ncbi:MAG: cysteine desulfurase family protein [Allosphingosinicella sp.]|uniref:cysteine desulfurase family protein n=1 Tax=Allosphingosinicella sp. TaxID=2823234 RepID=UPI003956BF9D
MPEVQNSTDGGRPIYLDHQSTTPVDSRVAALMVDVMTTRFGNAASADHFYGEEASALVAGAATEVAALVGASPNQVRFTSGATEAIRLAFQIARSQADRPLRVAASRAEHRAVLDQLERMERAGTAAVEWLSVDYAGKVALPEIARVLTDGVDLLCLMAANNEVGTLHSVQEAAERARDAGAEILVDATQAAGLVELDAESWGIDYLVLSGHKLYGPKGVGALIGPLARTDAADAAAGHAGTTNVPAVAGLGLACRIAREGMPEFAYHLRGIRDRLETALKSEIPGLVVNGDRLHRLPHNLHVSVPGAPNHAVVARLRREVAISTGAACSSGAQEPSHVLRAMGLSDELQETALRISPGRGTSLQDADQAAEAIIRAALAVRSEVRECA